MSVCRCVNLVVAIAWGTVGSVVIILLPVAESWTTITKVCAGMFTNDAVYDRLDDVNLRLRAIMGAMPEAEKRYRQLHETEMHPAGTHPANDDDDDNNNNQMMHS